MASKKSGGVVPFASKRLVGIDGGADAEVKAIEVKIISTSGNVVFEAEAISVMADEDYRCVSIGVLDENGNQASHLFVLGGSFLLHANRKLE
jgi:hypothetical protein